MYNISKWFKCVICILLTIMVSSCSFFQVRKPIIEQGNIITEQETARLHPGMSIEQVTEIMGTPVVINLFTPERVEYIYTYKSRTNPLIIKRVSLIFHHGSLQVIHRAF